MKANEIRRGLTAARRKREKGDALIKEGTAELQALFPAVQASDEVTMAEGARLAGVSRKTAHGMLRESAEEREARS